MKKMPGKRKFNKMAASIRKMAKKPKVKVLPRPKFKVKRPRVMAKKLKNSSRINKKLQTKPNHSQQARRNPKALVTQYQDKKRREIGLSTKVKVTPDSPGHLMTSLGCKEKEILFPNVRFLMKVREKMCY